MVVKAVLVMTPVSIIIIIVVVAVVVVIVAVIVIVIAMLQRKGGAPAEDGARVAIACARPRLACAVALQPS